MTARDILQSLRRINRQCAVTGSLCRSPLGTAWQTHDAQMTPGRWCDRRTPLVPEVAGRTADVGASELAARLPRSPTRTRSSPAARPCSTGAGASALVLDFFRDLLPQSPRSAARLLGQLFRLDGHAFEHSDESRDAIAEVMRQAVTDYSQAWAAESERDIDALPANVLAVYFGNAYGVHDEIIVAFRHALGRAGFDVWTDLYHRA